MSKAKGTKKIEVSLILKIFKKLERDAKKQAELLTFIREQISCLDLNQTIPVVKPLKGCGWVEMD